MYANCIIIRLGREMHVIIAVKDFSKSCSRPSSLDRQVFGDVMVWPRSLEPTSCFSSAVRQIPGLYVCQVRTSMYVTISKLLGRVVFKDIFYQTRTSIRILHPTDLGAYPYFMFVGFRYCIANEFESCKSVSMQKQYDI